MSAVDADKLLEMQQQQATEEDQEALSRQQILTMTSGPSEDAIASLSDYGKVHFWSQMGGGILLSHSNLCDLEYRHSLS